MQNNTKQNIRAQLRKKRISITESDRKRATLQIQRNILQQCIRRKKLKVAIYESMGSEVSLKMLIQTILKNYSTITLYKPIYYRFHKRMWFAPLYKSKQPKNLPIEYLDIVLTPILGIDFNGFRLGQGGGYYDSSFKHALLNNKPQKIAIGFDFQLIDFIPHEKHDIQMNAFISEKRRLKFKKINS